MAFIVSGCYRNDVSRSLQEARQKEDDTTNTFNSDFHELLDNNICCLKLKVCYIMLYSSWIKRREKVELKSRVKLTTSHYWPCQRTGKGCYFLEASWRRSAPVLAVKEQSWDQVVCTVASSAQRKHH